jgi:pimeloyl-ACP methyl ester carboxylesterase
VCVHTTPFRPHGTGLKDGAAHRLPRPADVVYSVRRLIVALLVLAVTAPVAPAPASAPHPRRLGPYGTGADAYWLWRAQGKPRAVVIFLHGLARSELSPVNHLPWIEHLARQGDDVVYPTYETEPGARGAVRHIFFAVDAAMRRLGKPKAPVVIVGYSRGGRLAVEFAAVAPAILVFPKAVMSIFPSELNPVAEETIDLRTLPPVLKIMLVVGQEDSRAGARELLDRLAAAGFPAANVQAVVIRSKGSFHADHFSALQTGPEARRQFWDRLDRLIRSVR